MVTQTVKASSKCSKEIYIKFIPQYKNCPTIYGASTKLAINFDLKTVPNGNTVVKKDGGYCILQDDDIIYYSHELDRIIKEFNAKK